MALKINANKIELVPLKDIKLNPKNRNKHSPEQIAQFVKILRYQGNRNPGVISNRSGLLVAGEGRYLAMKEAGETHMPVMFQDFEDEEQEYLYGISDNAIASQAALDLAEIHVDLKDMGPFDLDLLGIRDFQFEPDPDAQGDPDAVPEVPKVAKTKRGELWTLGNHRLLIDDCTVKENVDRLIGAGPECLVAFTSPPYNAAKNSPLNGRVAGFEEKYENSNDAMSDDEYLRLLVDSTTLACDRLNYVFVNLQLLAHNRKPLIDYQHAFRDKLKDILIWNKSQCPPNIVKGAFNTKWEYVFCFSDDCETRGFPVDWRGQYPNVVETESNSGNEFADDHRAGFPVSLPRWFLEKLPFAKCVYDPFAGTGSTAIAAESLGRSSLLMELDPLYGDVILTRRAKFTGKDPVREDGMRWSELNG